MVRLQTLLVSLIDPRGRCNRKGLLMAAALLLAVQSLAGLWVWLAEIDIGSPPVISLKIVALAAAVSAAVQRLHDLGRSAWMILWAMLAWIGIAFAAGAVTMQVLPPESMQFGRSGFLVVLMATTIPMLGALLWMHLAPGEARANRYGPTPEGLGFSRHRDRSRAIAGAPAASTA